MAIAASSGLATGAFPQPGRDATAVDIVYNLQALRGVAALLVVMLHVDVLLAQVGLPKFGGGGVDVFFVISGFVMVHATRARAVTPSAFLAQRLARVAPLYWLATLAVFALALAAPRLFQSTAAHWDELIKSLLFVPFRKSSGEVEPTLFLGWTLNYEIFFYLLFACGLAFRSYAAGIAWTFGAILMLVLAGGVLRPQDVVAAFYTDPILVEFAAGMGLGLAWPHLKHTALWPGAHAAALAIALFALAALIAAPLMAPRAPQLIATGAPAVVLVGAALVLERSGWALGGGVVMMLGDASYSIYLSHPFVTQAFQKAAMALNAPPVAAPFVLAACLMCVIAIGVALHRWLERPICTWVRGRLAVLERRAV